MLKSLSILFICSIAFVRMHAQCRPDVFNTTYTGNAAFGFSLTKSCFNSEIVGVGSALQITFGALGNDAYVQKLSARGNILFAKRYMMPGFNNGGFNTFVQTLDSGFLLLGQFSLLVKRASDGVIDVTDKTNVLVKIDKYGNVDWVRRQMQYETFFNYFNNLITLPDGNIFGTSSLYGSGFTRVLLFKITPNGDPIWTNLLESGQPNISNIYARSIGNTIIAAGPSYTTNAAGQTNKNGFFSFNIDEASGSIGPGRFYYFDTTTRMWPLSNENVVKIIPQGNTGNYTLFSNYSRTATVLLPPYTQAGLGLQFNAGGTILKATAYMDPLRGYNIASVSDTALNGSYELIGDDGLKSSMLNITNTGNIQWQRSYPGIDGNLRATSFLQGLPNKRIFFTGRTQVALIGLLKTEQQGQITCVDDTSFIQTRNITDSFTRINFNIIQQTGNVRLFEPTVVGLFRTDYNLNPNVSCIVSCCPSQPYRDTSQVKLCNSTGFTLPNGSLVKETGIYYHQFTTALGCDSIQYYNVQLLTKPKISLGLDTCLGTNTNITLRVDSGYAPYTWNGAITNNHFFTTNQQGTVTVSATNFCGTTTSAAQVFTLCEYPIFMPNAFTPNNDGLNDIFEYPRSNKNIFVSLTVFDRWGKALFTSNQASVGWRGRDKNFSAPAGVYTYQLVTLNFFKKKIITTGTITLIR
jgi:gliding motility-associated-like protein